ncbi:MAG: hypothetical protein AB7F86_07535 [Bdellovibrionales bacterium]
MIKLLNWINDLEAIKEESDEPEPEPGPMLRQKLEELGHLPVTELMVPRPLIHALDADVQLKRIRRLKTAKEQFFPVYKGDLDQILGWVAKTKVVELLNQSAEENALAKQAQPIPEVSDQAVVSDLTDVFIESHSPMIVVKNQEDQTVGLVTLPDFIERLFGVELDSDMRTGASADSPSKTYEA